MTITVHVDDDVRAADVIRAVLAVPGVDAVTRPLDRHQVDNGRSAPVENDGE